MQADRLPHAQTSPLSLFEVPRAVIEPIVSALRLGNTALDVAFYDVGALASASLREGGFVEAVRLCRVADPEGAIVIVDAATSPYITRRFDDVAAFIDAASTEENFPRAISITGIGSSALGSVAFAWNISRALGQPVAAIVPGYGVADAFSQALGGWFGLGLHGWMVKNFTQNWLAWTLPETARIGRSLMLTAPGHTQAPVFEHGCGSSDVLHTILSEIPGSFDFLFGHSKGALAIQNAVTDLNGTAKHLLIATFGCPINDSEPASYQQTLGWFDLLGWMNSWGNEPDRRIPSRHTTNTWIPFGTPVEYLVSTR